MKNRLSSAGLAVGIFLAFAASAGAQQFTTPTVSKTVGTSPGSCSPNKHITVLPGTTVYFCYTITNPNEESIAFNLTDNVLGSIGGDVVDPQGSTTIDGIAEVVNGSVTNTATWSFTDEINQTGSMLSAAARRKLGPAITGDLLDVATVTVVNPLVPTLSDAGMLLLGLGIVGSALLLLRRAA